MAFSAERSHHCPFLNRTDSRCGSHFHLDQLDHAFEFCFDRYTACPTYLERLVERRLRQDEQSQPPERDSNRVQVTISVKARRTVGAAVGIGVGVGGGDSIASSSIIPAPNSVAVALGQTVPGPRISAHSILRGFDRFARRTVFRETPAGNANAASHASVSHSGRAA